LSITGREHQALARALREEIATIISLCSAISTARRSNNLRLRAADLSPAGQCPIPSMTASRAGAQPARTSSQSTVANNSIPNGDSNPSITAAACSSAGR
jgi:hypothetical protein